MYFDMKLLIMLTLFTYSLTALAGAIEDFEKITPIGSWSKRTVYEKKNSEKDVKSAYKKILTTTIILANKETDGIRVYYWVEIQTKDIANRTPIEYTLVKVSAEKFAKLHLNNISFFTDPNYLIKVPGMTLEYYSSKTGKKISKQTIVKLRDKLNQFAVIITSIKDDKTNLTLSGKTLPVTKHTYTTDTIQKPGEATRKLLKNSSTEKAQKRALKREHDFYFGDKHPFRFVKSVEKYVNNPNKNVLIKAGMRMGAIPDQRKSIVTNLSAFGYEAKKSVLLPLIKK